MKNINGKTLKPNKEVDVPVKLLNFSQELASLKSLCRISISNYGDVSSVL